MLLSRNINYKKVAQNNKRRFGTTGMGNATMSFGFIRHINSNDEYSFDQNGGVLNSKKFSIDKLVQFINSTNTNNRIVIDFNEVSSFYSCKF